jgi:hypothetical protein
MVAAQRLNGEPPITIFGIVSNGATWQFGQLEATVLTKNTLPYTIYDLDRLFAGVNAVFQQCEAQLEILTAA